MLKKSRMIERVLLFILILSLSTGCSKGKASDKSIEQQKSSVQNPAKGNKWGDTPDFTLPKFGGGQFRLSSLKGKVIILDFWAIRCPPCREEIPNFVALHNKYKNQGLEIVGVCLDKEAKVKPFAKKMGIKYTLVFGNQETTDKYRSIKGTRGMRYIPTTLVIDKNGNIAKVHIGFVSKETFEEEIKELLK